MNTKTIFEYALQKISDLSNDAQLVVIFDPSANLELPEFIQDSKHREWQVVVYDGNDFAFYQNRPEAGRQVVWVILPESERQYVPPELRISSITDILQSADLLIDASLPAILKKRFPKLQEFFSDEIWENPAVPEYVDILGENLDKIPGALQSIRRRLPSHPEDDESVIRALALHCLCPQVAADEFLFVWLETPAQVLEKYLSLVWKIKWDERGLNILRSQARTVSGVSVKEILPLLTADPDDLAVYIYLRRQLERRGISDPAGLLRKSGAITLDHDLLEAPNYQFLHSLFDKKKDLEETINDRAESSSSPGLLEKILNSLSEGVNKSISSVIDQDTGENED